MSFFSRLSKFRDLGIWSPPVTEGRATRSEGKRHFDPMSTQIRNNQKENIRWLLYTNIDLQHMVFSLLSFYPSARTQHQNIVSLHITPLFNGRAPLIFNVHVPNLNYKSLTCPCWSRATHLSVAYSNIKVCLHHKVGKCQTCNSYLYT